MQRKTNTRVTLNISGEIFETFSDTLSRFPNTLLAKITRYSNTIPDNPLDNRFHHYDAHTNQFFFDRNRLCFHAILFYYQSRGTLNCPTDIPIPIFEEECRYFEIDDDVINTMKRKEGILFDFEKDGSKALQDGSKASRCHTSSSFRMSVWEFLEDPNSSFFAWVFGMFSLAMIWVSIITGSLETLPLYHMHTTFNIIEVASNIWFLIELLLRFIFARSKGGFIRSLMNWIDMLSVLPFFLVLVSQTKKTGMIGISKTLKILRITRLFRLSKHSRRLKVVGKILQMSLGNFKLLMVCLVMVIFFGETLMFYCEQYNGNHYDFASIPHGLWWATQTITSVGYGDVIPTSLGGRLFACCFMFFGALTISLPVVTIVSQFTELYPKNVACDVYMKEYEEKARNALKEKKYIQGSM